MKKTAVLLTFIFLLVFTHLAFAASTQMPNLIGTWTGTTTQVGSTTKVNVTLVVTAALPASVTNKKFSGTMTIGAETFAVIVNNTREFYKVDIFPADSQVLFSFGGALAWLPGPMLMVHGLGYNNNPYRAFILKKTTS
ncbi:MAG: hypothetical protein C4567_15895 [Deltaproteobacteria bacterium]|nr:MAG: hypothetical protein C4567_15895 [Deltaproteobacteria bacterium]